jgi:hypothetical protein
MSTAGIVLVVGIGLMLFLLAAVVIGRESHRLDAIAPRAVYEPEEAVEFVADQLPIDVQAHLTYEELRGLLVAHMRWLHAKGLQPDDVVDRRQDLTEAPVVVEDVTAVGYLIGVAEASDIEVDDVAVAIVVDAHLAYLDAIGAVGPEAADPDVPVRQLGAGSWGELGSGDGERDAATAMPLADAPTVEPLADDDRDDDDDRDGGRGRGRESSSGNDADR